MVLSEAEDAQAVAAPDVGLEGLNMHCSNFVAHLAKGVCTTVVH